MVELPPELNASNELFSNAFAWLIVNLPEIWVAPSWLLGASKVTSSPK
jgi:hypothetical protein